MDITAALDIAFGLVLMYLVLSLFCTTINEFIASLIRLRAKTLKSALEQLIDDPALKNAFDLHGLIDTAKIAVSGGKQATTPAAAALPPGQEPAAPAQGAQVPAKAGTWLSRWWNNSDPSYLSSRNVALALISSVDPTAPVPGVAAIQAAVIAMPDSNIRDVLLTALAEAQGDIQTLRNSVATWFDNSMDRLSGAYKRNMQLVSLLVGFAIAVAFNADTLSVGAKLWQDRSISASIAQATPAIVQKVCAAGRCTGTPSNPASVDAAARAVGDNLGAVQNNLRGLPLGWPSQSWPKDGPAFDWALLFKAIGLVLTAVALAMGAPFWFDVLQKIMNFRATGDLPDKSKVPAAP